MLTDMKGKALSDSAASNGKMNWYDAATGKSGSGAMSDYVEVAARVLLADKESMKKDFFVKELPRAKGSPYAVRLTPRLFGSNLESATVWTDGKVVTAMEMRQRDQSRIYLAVLAFEPNAKVSPKDFVLQ